MSQLAGLAPLCPWALCLQCPAREARWPACPVQDLSCVCTLQLDPATNPRASSPNAWSTASPQPSSPRVSSWRALPMPKSADTVWPLHPACAAARRLRPRGALTGRRLHPRRRQARLQSGRLGRSTPTASQLVVGHMARKVQPALGHPGVVPSWHLAKMTPDQAAVGAIKHLTTLQAQDTGCRLLSGGSWTSSDRSAPRRPSPPPGSPLAPSPAPSVLQASSASAALPPSLPSEAPAPSEASPPPPLMCVQPCLPLILGFMFSHLVATSSSMCFYWQHGSGKPAPEQQRLCFNSRSRHEQLCSL